MTWTIEISLIDIICRYIAGIGAIIVLILIIIEQKRTKKFIEEELKRRESEADNETDN